MGTKYSREMSVGIFVMFSNKMCDGGCSISVFMCQWVIPDEPHPTGLSYYLSSGWIHSASIQPMAREQILCSPKPKGIQLFLNSLFIG